MDKLGLTIVFEGPDGSGKTSQSQALADILTKEGHTVYRMSFPSYHSVIGNAIRNIINSDEFNKYSIEDIQRLFLREQIHFFRSLKRVQKLYDYIILDRSYISTLIYSTCFGAKEDFIQEIKESTRIHIPDFDLLFILGKNYVNQSIDKIPEDKIEEHKDKISKSFDMYYDVDYIKQVARFEEMYILEHKTKEKNLKEILKIIKKYEGEFNNANTKTIYER